MDAKRDHKRVKEESDDERQEYEYDTQTISWNLTKQKEKNMPFKEIFLIQKEPPLIRLSYNKI